MIKEIKNKRSGFTLVETFFGISILILLVMGISLFGRNMWVYNSFISNGFASVDAGRQTIKKMIAEIRTASSSNIGTYAISEATPTSFTFFSDINDTGLKQQVRYFLNGSTLQKGVITPTGSPLSYNSGSEIITTLLTDVTSTSIFEYHNSNYDGTTAPLSAPVDVSAVRLVKVTIVVDKNPIHSPAPITFSTQVTLRNLKDNL